MTALREVVDRLIDCGMPSEDAWGLAFRAFEERAKELQGRFPDALSLRAGNPWVDGWLTATEYMNLNDPNLYGPGGVPL